MPGQLPAPAAIDDCTKILRDWGFEVEVGNHVLDRHGYMAGRDNDRLADLNAAYTDPTVRAVITTRGGAGAYRILDGLDFDAIRADPKPLLHRNPQLTSTAVEVVGRAEGILIGGWLGALAGMVGAQSSWAASPVSRTTPTAAGTSPTSSATG
ncbi:LD-carboxypeptidase [Nocardia colli]|uniref:LD-carboxypeptidase n=1 Tax=Nocardia colli TaxID=2545717 RepID=UPI001CC4DFDA|nr:LD-carboxypeptidase [Nocardia colli]